MLKPGDRVDRYVVEAELGQGGLAVVYRVRHRTLDTLHALKVLTVRAAGLKDRLVQEGRLQARIGHPNVLAVTDVIEVDGAPALLMEYVDGSSLDRWLERHREAGRRPDLGVSLDIYRGIVEGVAAAHRLGLVHRDLKPGNVLLDRRPDGRPWPKVADFGLAKVLAEGGGHTRSGVAMGTPAYMSPEQVRDAKNVDHRSDLFSLGAILYELVVGEPPFLGPDLLAIFNAIAASRYTPPAERVPDLPEPVARAVAGCLQADPEARIPSCEALLSVLDGASLPVAVQPPAVGETLAPPPVEHVATLRVPSLAGEVPVPQGESGGEAEAPVSAHRRPALLVLLLLILLGSLAVAALRVRLPAPAGEGAADVAAAPELERPEGAARGSGPARDPAPSVDAGGAPSRAVAPRLRRDARPLPARDGRRVPARAVPTPAPGRGEVVVRGDAHDVWLLHLPDGRRYEPGTLPPGSYEVVARFDPRDTPREMGRIEVVDGARLPVLCRRRTGTCRW